VTLYILLPAFNEAEALSRLIPDLVAALGPDGHPYEIIVVNDASTDATGERLAGFARDFPVRELKHEKNRGYGGALATGYGWILDHAHGDDIVVSLDADNSHPPRYVQSLVQGLEQGADVVTASYALPGSRVFGVPPLRRVTSAICNCLFRLLYPHAGVRTYTNGFRAYRLRALQKVSEQFGYPVIKEGRFPGGTELFLKTLATGARAAEVPFELHYENRGGGSKIRIGQTIVGYLRLLHRLRRQIRL